MNEIEKLYETAGVEPYRFCDSCIKNSGSNITDPHDCSYRDICGNDCDKPHYIFTAEKQLEIVKMILFSTWWMNLKRLQFSEKFDEALAQMINELWEDLTVEEQEEIRKMKG